MHDRPALPFGPQPQIDAIGDAQLGRLGEQPHHVAGQPVEELAIAPRPRAVGLAVRVVEKDQVDVARIIQLDAAELAHRQHDEPGRLAVAACAARRASARACAGPTRTAASRIASARCEICRGDGVEALPADDVAVGDPQRLAALEAPQGRQDGRFVAQRRDLARQLVRPASRGRPAGLRSSAAGRSSRSR